MRNESKTDASAMVVKVLKPDNPRINDHIETVYNNSFDMIQMNEPKVKIDKVLEGIITAADKRLCLQVTVIDKTSKSHKFPFMQVGL